MPTFSHTDGCVSLPANLTVRTATATHEALLCALNDHAQVVIALPDDPQVDLSFVQTVEAARLQAAGAGKAISLSAPASGGLLEALRRGGLLEGMSAEDAKFWLHQGDF